MDSTLLVVKPCLTEIVGTAKSRKRSRPSPVATQILPSRSSKRSSTESPERPSDCVKMISPLPGAHERDLGPVFRSTDRHCDPGVSRKGLNCGPVPGSGYASAFPSTSCMIPPRVAIKSASLSPSHQGVDFGGRVRQRNEFRRTRLPSPQPGPRSRPEIAPAILIQGAHSDDRNCRPLRSTGRCHSESRRVSRWESSPRRPIPFLHDPQGAYQLAVQQAPGTESACRPSSWPALYGCQSKDFHRAQTSRLRITLPGRCSPVGGSHGTARTPSKRSKPKSVPSQR